MKEESEVALKLILLRLETHDVIGATSSVLSSASSAYFLVFDLAVAANRLQRKRQVVVAL